jgi:hypothetical protein
MSFLIAISPVRRTVVKAKLKANVNLFIVKCGNQVGIDDEWCDMQAKAHHGNVSVRLTCRSTFWRIPFLNDALTQTVYSNVKRSNFVWVVRCFCHSIVIMAALVIVNVVPGSRISLERKNELPLGRVCDIGMSAVGRHRNGWGTYRCCRNSSRSYRCCRNGLRQQAPLFSRRGKKKHPQGIRAPQYGRLKRV